MISCIDFGWPRTFVYDCFLFFSGYDGNVFVNRPKYKNPICMYKTKRGVHTL